MTRRPLARMMIVFLGLGAAAPALARKNDRDDDRRNDTRSSEPSVEERVALDRLAAEIRGALVYGRKGRIFKVVVGEWRPIDLGPGQFARWSADGRRIAVHEDGAVHVMNADGANRRRLCDDVDVIDDIPITFHPSGKEIVFTRRKTGLWAVALDSGAVRRLELPDAYTGEMRFSADGKRLATRVGRELYAVDVVAGTQRKYAMGCSPSVSPDGRRLMNNVGGHRTLVIRTWEGGDELRLDTRQMAPDREWNNHIWSNHPDYITAQGEEGGGEAYVVKVSENRPTRLTWQGKTSYPDLFVAGPAAKDRR